MQLMTIGYEGCTPETFFNELMYYNVQTLIDVRELPMSRKKGFAKTALRNAAQAHALTYIHMRDLGCPRIIRYDYRSDKDWKRFTQRYLAYLNTQAAAIAELAERVKNERCCLMCMEADPEYCHRTFIAQRIVELLGKTVTIVNLTHQIPNVAEQQAIEVGRSIQ